MPCRIAQQSDPFTEEAYSTYRDSSILCQPLVFERGRERRASVGILYLLYPPNVLQLGHKPLSNFTSLDYLERDEANIFECDYFDDLLITLPRRRWETGAN